MSNELKQIRGQLRQITKEVLPEVLKTEVESALYKELTAKVETTLATMQEEIRTTLERINEQHKNIMAYLIRSSAPSVPVEGEVKKDGETNDSGNR